MAKNKYKVGDVYAQHGVPYTYYFRITSIIEDYRGSEYNRYTLMFIIDKKHEKNISSLNNNSIYFKRLFQKEFEKLLLNYSKINNTILSPKPTTKLQMNSVIFNTKNISALSVEALLAASKLFSANYTISIKKLGYNDRIRAIENITKMFLRVERIIYEFNSAFMKSKGYGEEQDQRFLAITNNQLDYFAEWYFDATKEDK